MKLLELIRRILSKRRIQMEEESGNGRVRAWLLLKDTTEEDLRAKKEKIKKKDLGKEYPQVVVIRADLVQSAELGYRMVIPIDIAVSEYDRVLGEIRGEVGSESLAVLRVVDGEHDPPIPQDASGFISEGELKAGHIKKIDEVLPGRQDYSPGFNPWG
jgi:hypothetical protein